jgi:hypothetical protein
MSISWEQSLAWRLRRHQPVERAAPSQLVRVVGDICGLHAQLMSSAELSAWARVDGLERGAVEDVLWSEKSLVKLWAMRGTLHLLPSADLGIWLASLGTYTGHGMTGKYAVDSLTEAIGDALEGRLLTREGLAVLVEAEDPELGEWVRSSWGSYLKPASWRGRLCFAPSEGSRVRFTSPSTWLAGTIEHHEPADALLEVTRRFLAAYGPTTARHFGVWAGVGPARGARLLAALGDEAAELDLGGEAVWALTQDVAEIEAAVKPDVARLLPAFDPWVVGTSRTAMLEPRHRARVYRPQGWISPVLLVNGRIAGLWRHERKGGRLLVELEPFRRLAPWAREGLDGEAERLAAFLGLELSRVR